MKPGRCIQRKILCRRKFILNIKATILIITNDSNEKLPLIWLDNLWRDKRLFVSDIIYSKKISHISMILLNHDLYAALKQRIMTLWTFLLLLLIAIKFSCSCRWLSTLQGPSCKTALLILHSIFCDEVLAPFSICPFYCK